jgi:uncharacterized protein (DUF2147 family)
MTFGNTLAALALALTSLALPALASAADPTGTWQTSTGESRYAVSYCGDGTQLCARLTWLRDDAKTPENLALLGDYVVQGAQATGANQWQGRVSYEGDTYSGRVTMVTDDAMRLSGCQGIFCKSLQFERL